MDGDGDLDVVCAAIQGSGSVPFRGLLYRNDGQGMFSAELAALRLPLLAVGDVDRDGDLDGAPHLPQPRQRQPGGRT